MKFISMAFCALVSVAALSACSKSPPPADSLPVPAPAAATPADAPAAEPGTALADFSVTPGHVYSCEGRDRAVSVVKWQVKDPAVATVRVEVDTALEPERKTFTNGGNTGEETTGEWVAAGVRFHLVDAASGKELAKHEVTSLPCQ